MTGHGPDLVIGAALLLVGIAELIVAVKNAVKRARRRRSSAVVHAAAVQSCGEPTHEMSSPLVRCRGLIAEALIVRDRLSGQIDAATYQQRMKDLVSHDR